MRPSPRALDGGEMAFLRGLTFPGGQQPLIRGTSVYLRYPRATDYPEWLAVRAQSRDFLTPWEPSWPDDELSKPAFRRRLKRYEHDCRLDLGYAFLAFRHTDDALVGGVTLSNVRRGVVQTCAIGYWAGAMHARQGYIYDAVAAAVPFIFETLGLHRIEAACLPENRASRGLLAKAGFREEGLALRYVLINGAWRDHLLFGLTIDEPWPNLRAAR